MTLATPERFLQRLDILQTQFSQLEEEFDLTQFRFDQPHAVIKLDAQHYLHLNVRDPDDLSRDREVRRMQVCAPLGFLMDIVSHVRGNPIQLMRVVGQPLDWQAKRHPAPAVPLLTCFNAASAVWMFCPPLR